MATEKYNKDARILDNASHAATDSESDQDPLVHSPTLADEKVLEEHDEAERLLIESHNVPVGWEKDQSWTSRSHKRRKRGRNKRRARVNGEGSSVVYENEEGFRDTSADSSTDSLLLQTSNPKSKALRSSIFCWILMLFSIATLFAVLVFGARHASRLAASPAYRPDSHSNGTHTFGATTILISLDGFRADFLQRGLTPSLNAFITSGVSPKYLLPSFPSVTFPNHYTLVTGLYPESHGIVGNQFWDPEFEEEFYYTNTAISTQSKWWEKAEPLWVTAEKQGIKTAIHMWPGSEAHIQNLDPTYLDKFNADEKLPKKVDRILELLDMSDEERAQLIAVYVPDVDRDGHKYGPNSTEIRATIAEADNMLTLLIEGLLQRNLTEIVNLVVVSDHGMATMSARRMVQLDDITDMSLVDHIDGWPLRGLRLKNPERDVPVMYKQLSQAAAEHGTFDAYTLDTMPAKYHFANNHRLAPLWVVPRAGWLVVEKEEFDIAKALEAGQEFHPIGIHGFDHEHPLMRAIFIARGPAFPHPPNSRTPVFQNIEVYNIICDSLGLKPHPNNGTLRLPMKTEGLHSDYNEPVDLPQDDPADIHHELDEADSSKSFTPVSNETNSDSQDPPSDAKTTWWKYIHEQLQKAKDWAKQIIDSVKNNVSKANKTSTG